jgi:hypothetical protein
MEVTTLQWTQTSLGFQNWGTYLGLNLCIVTTIYKMNLMASLFHWIDKWCNFICCYVFSLLWYTCLKVKSLSGISVLAVILANKWCVTAKNWNAVHAVIWMGWNILTLSFCFVTPCSLVGGHQSCGGTCCLPHQNRTDIYRLNTQTRVSSKLWCHCTRPHSIIFNKREWLLLLLTKNTRKCTD